MQLRLRTEKGKEYSEEVVQRLNPTVRQDCEYKLSTPLNELQFRVVQRNGSSALVKSGAQYKMNATHLKNFNEIVFLQ